MSAPTLTAGSEQLTASWVDPATWNWGWGENNTNNDITEYHLRYREDGSESWMEINTGITTSHTITELTNGMNYAVQVRAVNAQGTGGWSASATATPIAPPTAPPAAPGTIAAPTFEAGNGLLIATWTAPTDNGGSPITGYELRYRADDTEPWTIISSGIACENSEGQAEVCHFSFSSYSPYTIHSITADGANYQLQVRAVNAQGAGEWSASAMLLFATQLPAGESASAIVPADIDNPLAPEIATELSISLTTVGASNITVVDGDITKVTSAATPVGVTPPIVDSSSGLITLTVSAETTAGTYVVYGTGTGDAILFAEYFFVTESPTTNAELKTAVNAGISNWGDTGNFNYIITTAVTDMIGIFSNKGTFNGDISRWDVSSVTDMTSMFTIASTFNGDISGWDVSSVTDMTSMFSDTTAFNQDLEEWKDHWTLENGGIDNMGDTDAANDEYIVTVTNMFLRSKVGSGQPNAVAFPSWYNEIIAYQ